MSRSNHSYGVGWFCRSEMHSSLLFSFTGMSEICYKIKTRSVKKILLYLPLFVNR